MLTTTRQHHLEPCSRSPLRLGQYLGTAILHRAMLIVWATGGISLGLRLCYYGYIWLEICVHYTLPTNHWSSPKNPD